MYEFYREEDNNKIKKLMELAIKLKNSGKIVDFAAPWGQGHGGDYDLDELFDWIDTVVNK